MAVLISPIVDFEGNTYKVINKQVFRLTGKCDSQSCNAWCCRHIEISADVKRTHPSNVKWFKYHAENTKEANNKLYSLIKCTCSQLDPISLKCSIHNERPESCIAFAGCDLNIFNSDKCTLWWKEIDGEDKEVILKKLKTIKLLR